jgi:hypothetical protein
MKMLAIPPTVRRAELSEEASLEAFAAVVVGLRGLVDLEVDDDPEEVRTRPRMDMIILGSGKSRSRRWWMGDGGWGRLNEGGFIWREREEIIRRYFRLLSRNVDGGV